MSDEINFHFNYNCCSYISPTILLQHEVDHPITPTTKSYVGLPPHAFPQSGHENGERAFEEWHKS